MKLSRSRVRSIVAAASGVAFVAFVAATVLSFPAMAFATLEASPTVTSATNPDPEGHLDPNSWRDGWGNTLYPEFSFSNIPSDEGLPTFGFTYRVARFPIFPDDPFSMSTDITYDTAGTMVGHVLDIPGIYDELPDIERVASEPGINDRREGRWVMVVRFFNGSRDATMGYAIPFGIDLTPPRPVRGFTTGVTLPTETRRRTLTWINEDYDDLSGSHFFSLYLNGKKIQDITLTGWMPGKVTIEDLPPGVNKLGIRSFDRATNVSTMVYHTDVVDPDVPSLGISAPKAGAWLSGTQTFSVISTDAACKPTVTFKIDGVAKGTDSAPPYQLSVNTRNLSAGSHTLSVTAKDLFGHYRTASRTFNVDNTAIRLTSMSVYPNPFYPVLHDDYKDTATMKVYLNESASDAYLEVYDASGGMVRQYRKTGVAAGWLSMSWDGKNSTGNVATGTFWFRFKVKDRAGNWTTTGMNSLVIRDYEVVRVGPGTVRIVPR